MKIVKSVIAVVLLLSGAAVAQVDPCKIPQMFLDTVDFGAEFLANGGPQNQPSQPVPGASLPDLATGIKALEAWQWYQTCSLHQAQAAVAQLNGTIALQNATIALQQKTIDGLITQLNMLLLKTAPVVSALTPTCTFVPPVAPAIVGSATCSFIFSTTIPTTSVISYGIASRVYPKNSAADGTGGLIAAHNISVTLLVPGTTYFFSGRATSAVGAQGLSPEVSLVAPTQ